MRTDPLDLYKAELELQMEQAEHIVTLANETKADMFLDWFNNFLTIKRFAEYYGMTIDDAKKLIEEGRKLHEERAANAKKI